MNTPTEVFTLWADDFGVPHISKYPVYGQTAQSWLVMDGQRKTKLKKGRNGLYLNAKEALASHKDRIAQLTRMLGDAVDQAHRITGVPVPTKSEMKKRQYRTIDDM
jgi:hypothetical protein